MSYMNYLLQDHTAQCTKFPVSCPNRCGASFPREKVRLSKFQSQFGIDWVRLMSANSYMHKYSTLECIVQIRN